MKAVSFGEVLWDIFEDAEYLGGAPFNLSVHLAQMGCESSIITRIGDDRHAHRILDEIHRLGVDDGYVQTDPQHPTGTVSVTLSHTGHPSYIIHENAAWDFIDISDATLAQFRKTKFDVFCFGTVAQRWPTSRRSLYRLLDLQCARHVFCDINLRQHYYDAKTISRSLDYADIVKLNDEEVRALSNLLFGRSMLEAEFAVSLQKRFGVEVICVTRGKSGCTVFHLLGAETIPGVPVEVADTVGAGDAFSAAFLHKFCEGASPHESATFANRIGAFVASRRGAIPAYTEEILRDL